MRLSRVVGHFSLIPWKGGFLDEGTTDFPRVNKHKRRVEKMDTKRKPRVSLLTRLSATDKTADGVAMQYL
jgi:hypothetical protein